LGQCQASCALAVILGAKSGVRSVMAPRILAEQRDPVNMPSDIARASGAQKTKARMVLIHTGSGRAARLSTFCRRAQPRNARSHQRQRSFPRRWPSNRVRAYSRYPQRREGPKGKRPRHRPSVALRGTVLCTAGCPGSGPTNPDIDVRSTSKNAPAPTRWRTYSVPLAQ